MEFEIKNQEENQGWLADKPVWVQTGDREDYTLRYDKFRLKGEAGAKYDGTQHRMYGSVEKVQSGNWMAIIACYDEEEGTDAHMLGENYDSREEAMMAVEESNNPHFSCTYW